MKFNIRLIHLLLLVVCSCNDTPPGTNPELTVCNNVLLSCLTPQNVPYCTFGYKFGKPNPFSPSGAGIPGPKENVNEISYKFQDAGFMFKSIRQDHAVSLAFSEEDKSTVRTTISKWSAVANFDLVEKPGSAITDITIISSFIPI